MSQDKVQLIGTKPKHTVALLEGEIRIHIFPLSWLIVFGCHTLWGSHVRVVICASTNSRPSYLCRELVPTQATNPRLSYTTNTILCLCVHTVWVSRSPVWAVVWSLAPFFVAPCSSPGVEPDVSDTGSPDPPLPVHLLEELCHLHPLNAA